MNIILVNHPVKIPVIYLGFNLSFRLEEFVSAR